jgi:hypothetical protein
MKIVYDWNNKSESYKFRIIELFDKELLLKKLTELTDEIKGKCWAVGKIKYLQEPKDNDSKYEWPSHRWGLAVEIILEYKRYFIVISSARDGFYVKLKTNKLEYIEVDLRKAIFGDINKDSMFSRDFTNITIMFKDLFEEIYKYEGSHA